MRLEDRVRELERNPEDVQDEAETSRPPKRPQTSIDPPPAKFRRMSIEQSKSPDRVRFASYPDISGDASFTSSLRRAAGNQTRGPSSASPLSYDRANQALNTSSGDAIGVGRTGTVSAMVGAVLDSEQGFYGGSSAASFVRQLKKAVDTKIKSPPTPSPSTTILDQVQLSMLAPDQINRPRANINYVLPPRKVADALLDLYWVKVHTLYPFLDVQEATFAYQALWTGHGPGSDEPMFLCILNVIFALSCQLSDTIRPEQREASADVFFYRAREMLNFDMLQLGTFQSVQSFLLLSQYLQSTNDPHQCWLVVGIAIRTAQSLGLHLPETSAHVDSPRHRELIRKIWHGCVVMDRITSMVYGRPTMISKQSAAAVPLPLPIDEEYLETGPPQGLLDPERKPAIMDFFIQTLGLYSLMNEILSNFYEPFAQENEDDAYDLYFGYSSKREGRQSVIDLDRKLNLWNRRLPLHLRSRDDTRGEGIFWRQSNILHSR